MAKANDTSAGGAPTLPVQATEPEVQYASLADLIPPGPIDPISEDYQIPGTQFTFRIGGVATYEEREGINHDIAVLAQEVTAGKLKVTVGSGEKAESFTPTPEHIRYASWCKACIKHPQGTRRQWLQFAYDKSGWLYLLYIRCLVCSRMIEDKDDVTGETITPDGLDAAKGEIAKDPLD